MTRHQAICTGVLHVPMLSAGEFHQFNIAFQTTLLRFIDNVLSSLSDSTLPIDWLWYRRDGCDVWNSQSQAKFEFFAGNTTFNSLTTSGMYSKTTVFYSLLIKWYDCLCCHVWQCVNLPERSSNQNSNWEVFSIQGDNIHPCTFFNIFKYSLQSVKHYM